ncbi:Do family serine endopeptidase [Bombella sp. TMW 2.2559]|uniref:Probable periplasmic serine endoprotease DegP-like n=1 Tax=Bombella dulcis TaxID=2967339 RepID=A0ABT3WIX9_9PROT|nr:Do family serine endopeptidase [Bombella dulcis]MCX5616796.1 Do family serine endopeptidase [Bombella dulcis]
MSSSLLSSSRPWLVRLLACAGLVASSVQAQDAAPGPSPVAEGPPSGGTVATATRAAHEAAMMPGFAALVEKLLPAVVNISVSSVIHPDTSQPEGPDGSTPSGPQSSPFPPGSPLEKFFHDYLHHRHGDGRPGRQVQALGSGFIIDPSGVVVTNNHVIDNAQQVSVTLSDGTEYPASIVGRDSKEDLAVLQVKADRPLPSVPLGHSDEARIGDWVLAIGNPFGLSGTVTAGIISSRKRNVDHGLYDDFIQTDAAINHGNSGGPLFNLKGEVIGINTLIYGGSGGDSIGIGFAIPSDDARGIISQLRQTGYVRRGWLGVRYQDVTRSMAEDLEFHKADAGRERGTGAIVASVDRDGPAQKAGLKVGDILTVLNGQPVTGQTLPRLVAGYQPGETVHFTLWRRGNYQKLDLTLGKNPEEKDPLPSDTHPPEHPVKTLRELGLKLGVIDQAARTQYELTDSQRGVLVMRVYEGSPAASRGLTEGNLILQVGQQEVNTPEALQTALDRAREMKRTDILLLVQDKDGLRWVAVPLGDQPSQQ